MRRRRIVQYSKEILVQHGRACPYCTVMMRVPLHARTKHNTPQFPTRDHVIPKSRLPGMGVLICCRACNQAKGDRTLSEWHRHLKATGDARAGIVKAFMEANRHLKSLLTLSEHME